MILNALEIDVCGFQNNIENIILRMEEDKKLNKDEKLI